MDPTDTTPVVQLADAPVVPEPSSPVPRFDYGKFILPGAILVAGIMISSALLYSRTQTGETLPNNNQALLGGQVDINLDDAPALGDKNAPVTIVAYADFQCPYCQRYAQNNKAMFISEYVNTGKAKFVWKDYAFLGQESLWAAEAARCANDQGKFWEYHDYLFANQGAGNSGIFSKLNLKKFAGTLKLNTSQFNSCLDSGKYTAFIQKESQSASSLGVTGTPTTFINGRLAADASGNSVGAAPFSVFKALIDQELSK